MKIRISKRNMDENLLLVNFLLCIFIVYFTIMKSSSMVSRLFTLSFFVTMIFFIHNSRSYQRTDFVIVIPCLALALINILLVSQQNINFGYLKVYHVLLHAYNDLPNWKSAYKKENMWCFRILGRRFIVDLYSDISECREMRIVSDI